MHEVKAWGVVRVDRDSGREFMLSCEVEPCEEMVERQLVKTCELTPAWAAANPVRRVVRVLIHELEV
jgi:hypothetical protein